MSKGRIETVCVVTGTRAEYGLLRPLIQRLSETNGLRMQLVVAGMHLSNEFGLTVREIEADGWPIDARIENQLSSDTRIGMAKSTSLALLGFADAFARLAPDMTVLLGDRYEIFGAAQAAFMLGIPIAHLHGGETTEGAMDEAFRHCITKLSHLHFPAAAPYAERIIAMGEAPERVHMVGALAVDNIKQIPLLDRRTLEKELGAQLGATNLLVTHHPATLAEKDAERSARALVDALGNVLARVPESRVFFTASNSDAGGRAINTIVSKFVAAHRGRAFSYVSLGQRRYLSLMKQAQVVVGNSSSGLFEAPYLGVPTVNIGDRQKGRLRPDSVLDCPEGDARAIEAATSRALRMKNVATTKLFGNGGTASRIVSILKKTHKAELGPKSFYDGVRK